MVAILAPGQRLLALRESDFGFDHRRSPVAVVKASQ